MEYASTVWDPHTQTNLQKLEMVQLRAARYVKNRQRHTSSVADMLSTLNLAKSARLEERCQIMHDV